MACQAARTGQVAMSGTERPRQSRLPVRAAFHHHMKGSSVLIRICVTRPRDGKQLTAQTLIHALQQGYGLSTPLAYILSYGGVGLLGQLGAFGLDDLARHNRIEHDASLVHDDTPNRDEYAPILPDSSLVKQFLNTAEDGQFMTLEDIAKARVLREAQSRPLDNLHAEIARGEMAIVAGLFDSRNRGIPVELLRTWVTEERLPVGWHPTHTQGLFQTMRASWQISSQMKAIRQEHNTKKLNPTSLYGNILLLFYFVRASLRFLYVYGLHGISH
jgi:Peroxidase, family 2